MPSTLVWFGRAGDSLVLSADAEAIQTTVGDEKDQLHNNVPRFHGRVPKDGAITIWVTLDGNRGDTLPYVLRIEDIPAAAVPSSEAALDASGETAQLTVPAPLHARRYVEFSVIPVSQVHPAMDRAPWKTGSVDPETLRSHAARPRP